MSETVEVTVNGRRCDLAPHTTVEAVVRSLTDASSGVAVAVNDEVVPRQQWAETTIHEHDRVDVLTAVQGG